MNLPRRTPWLAALALALLAIGLLAFRIAPQGERLARLSDAEGRLVFEIRHQDGQIRAQRTAGRALPDGQAHVLWLLAPDAQPVALGPLGASLLAVDYPRPPSGWVLAISVEATTDTPLAAPTGPLILSKRLDEGGKAQAQDDPGS